MMRLLLFALSFILLFQGCSHHGKHHERYYQEAFCERLGGVTEYRLSDRTRVDCLSGTYAVEVDFAPKWAEGIGQALFYAQMTGRAPAVALIAGKKDGRYIRRLDTVAKKYGIETFIIEKE